MKEKGYFTSFRHIEKGVDEAANHNGAASGGATVV
jgi:hypothetical protein